MKDGIYLRKVKLNVNQENLYSSKALTHSCRNRALLQVLRKIRFAHRCCSCDIQNQL